MTGPPPPVSEETSSALHDASRKDSTGQTAGGKDVHGNEEGQTVMGESGKEKVLEESLQDSGKAG